jgi:succinate-semialdehyde dehydrogenase/glutarate-semialdehyde dehydrogenase
MNARLRDSSLFKQLAYASGVWKNASDGSALEVRDPADGLPLGSVPALSAREVVEAIGAAQQAMAAWNRETAAQRSAILRRWFELITANTDDLAAILTAEQGKLRGFLHRLVCGRGRAHRGGDP